MLFAHTKNCIKSILADEICHIILSFPINLKGQDTETEKLVKPFHTLQDTDSVVSSFGLSELLFIRYDWKKEKKITYLRSPKLVEELSLDRMDMDRIITLYR